MKDLTKEVQAICDELRKDKSEGSYYYAWQANIAMAFKDTVTDRYNNLFDEAFGDESLHEIANLAAKRFLDQLIYAPKVDEILL